MNKVIQSYYSVMFRKHLSVYELRIMLRIVKSCQQYFKKSRISFDEMKQGLGDASKVMYNRFACPLAQIMGQSHSGYENVKEAFRRLAKEQIEFYDTKKRSWYLTQLISDVEINDAKGIVVFTCPGLVMKYFCDLSQGGYVKYDWELAFSMRNVYAARLFMMLSSLNKPLSFSYDKLRELFELGDKYKKISDFERRVLKPASDEIMKKGGKIVRYEVMRAIKDRKSSKVIAIKFYPLQSSDSKVKIEDKKGFDEGVIDMFVRVAEFSWREICGNRKDIEEFSKIENWKIRLVDLCRRAKLRGKNHGWIVQGIRSIIKEEKGLL